MLAWRCNPPRSTRLATAHPPSLAATGAAPRDRPRLFAGLSRASALLTGFGTALVVLIIAGGVTLMWQLRERDLREARQNAARIGLAVAEQTSRAIQATDLVLADLARDVRAKQLPSNQAFKENQGTKAIFANLAIRADSLPQVDAFNFVAADGTLVNTSRRWPAPDVNVADRDFAAWFRTHDATDAFVSVPVQNRTDHAWNAYVVRRVDAPDGTFIGMVQAALSLSYFHEFYGALVSGDGTMVTLARRDGTVLASVRAFQVGERIPAGFPFYRALETGVLDAVVDTPVAPERRLVTVHPLADYPLVVSVAVSEHDALAGWRRLSTFAAAGAAGTVLCVYLLLRTIGLQVFRLERSEASLAEQNARLEATRRDMEAQARELSESRARLAEQSTALQTTLGHTNQGIMMVAADGTVPFCNGRAMTLLDLPPDLMANRPTFAAVIAYQHSIDEFPPTPDLPSGVGDASILDRHRIYERTRPNGRVLEIETIPLPGGGMVRTYADITERRKSEAEVRYLAHHDSLTRLANRSVFTERLEQAIEHAARNRHSLAVLYVDLDGFKAVNDTHGHWTGDALLVDVADRLRGAVRDTDTVARMGGDEFAIIQPRVDGRADSERLADRVLAAMAEHYRFNDVQCAIGVSIGIALFPDHAAAAEQLLHMADIALYRAKHAGKGVYRVFDRAMDLRRTELTAMEQDLAQALANDELFLEYQPIVRADTRATAGFEALLRWRHPKHGLVGPGEFIPVAEASALIVPIGQWILETACAEAATWPEDHSLSVNLSPVQFTRGDLPAQIAAVLARTGLAPTRLNLEVTEGLLLEDTQSVLAAMAELRRTGVRFSLDDFGTAHSGLTYLRRFRFDVLKIDKSFVQDAAEHEEARAIVAAIVAIGAAFRLTVVAEGIETEGQLALLRQLGCGLVQGYLTGRPAAAPSTRLHAAVA